MPAETHVEQGPMDRQEVFELIRDRLADILEIEPSSITEAASFADDLDADSLALIELVEALEEELGERIGGFRIDDEDLEDLKTVRDAVDYVLGRVGRRRPTERPAPTARPVRAGGLEQASRGGPSRTPSCSSAPWRTARGAPSTRAAVQRAPRVPRRRRPRPGRHRLPVPHLPGPARGPAGQGPRRRRQRRGARRGGRGARHRRGLLLARARTRRAVGRSRRSWPTPWRRSSAPSTSTAAGTRRPTW